MSTTPTDEAPQGVLADLDSQGTTSFYWYLAVLSCIGGFLFGYDTAVIGSVLDFIPYHLSNFWTGYLVAGASLGAAVGALAAGPLTDKFGRKSLLIVDAGIYAAGALLSAVAPNAWVLIFARTLIGLAVGADSAIATAYIAEFAPKARRGALMIMQQWMITVGILVSYIAALVVFKVAPGAATGADWRIILGLGAIPAVIALALRTRMPESPRWLMLNERYADTAEAFDKLGMRVSEDQVRETAAQLKETERKLARKSLWTPGVKRALFVVGMFFVFQQITGINIPFYYGPQLLGTYFQSGKSAVDAAVAGVEAASILGLVNVIATYFAFRFIDKVGRRKLAIGGYIGMAIFILVASWGVANLTGLPRVWVVMIGFSFFISSFAIGVGGTGWLIQGEVFPTAVRGRAAATCASVDWLANFVIVQWFPTLNSHFGLAKVMVLFAVLAVLAIAFVWKFLPETKGVALEEVNAVFEKQAVRSPVSGSG
ncbi:MAG: transporter, family, arabinose:H+ symporter [Actinomycetota bacterium]|nr:transporter, family, arabinose:H+ symporter [Actinomycetota bacterium]